LIVGLLLGLSGFLDGFSARCGHHNLSAVTNRDVHQPCEPVKVTTQ
jgi:hypothetical protein